MGNAIRDQHNRNVARTCPVRSRRPLAHPKRAFPMRPRLHRQEQRRHDNVWVQCSFVYHRQLLHLELGFLPGSRHGLRLREVRRSNQVWRHVRYNLSAEDRQLLLQRRHLQRLHMPGWIYENCQPIIHGVQQCCLELHNEYLLHPHCGHVR